MLVGVNVRTSIIPVFIPHVGCPHQCIFCNQTKITGIATNITPDKVKQIIAAGLLRAENNVPEVAFYGGSFTALPKMDQINLLTPAHQFVKEGRISSIRLSTRPDYINDDILNMLTDFGVTTIELGAQSLDNKVLALAHREHTWQHVHTAVNDIKRANIKCGLQLMVGLPGEDWTSLILSAVRVAKLNPDFVRLYPTLVIDNTPLAEAFKANRFIPLSLRQAVCRCAYLKIYLEYQSKINIIRTGLQATDFLNQPGVVIAGPYHPAFGEMVDSQIFYLMIAHIIELQTARYLTIHHHPKDHSKLRGNNNYNLYRLKENYGEIEIRLVPDGNCKNELAIETGVNSYTINPNMIFFI